MRWGMRRVLAAWKPRAKPPWMGSRRLSAAPTVQRAPALNQYHRTQTTNPNSNSNSTHTPAHKKRATPCEDAPCFDHTFWLTAKVHPGQRHLLLCPLLRGRLCTDALRRGLMLLACLRRTPYRRLRVLHPVLLSPTSLSSLSVGYSVSLGTCRRLRSRPLARGTRCNSGHRLVPHGLLSRNLLLVVAD